MSADSWIEKYLKMEEQTIELKRKCDSVDYIIALKTRNEELYNNLIRTANEQAKKTVEACNGQLKVERKRAEKAEEKNHHLMELMKKVIEELRMQKAREQVLREIFSNQRPEENDQRKALIDEWEKLQKN